MTPAFPNFILLPTSTKSSTSAYATLRPAECKSDVPVLKLDAEDIPVVLTWYEYEYYQHHLSLMLRLYYLYAAKFDHQYLQGM